MACCHQQLAGVQPAKGVAAVAVDGRLKAYSADALERTHEKSIHCYKVAGMLRSNAPLPKLGAEALQQPNAISCDSGPKYVSARLQLWEATDAADRAMFAPAS